MKKILGLDLGTNSIGWAVVNAEEVTRENETTYLKPVEISAAGSRIIPMDEGTLGDFDRGNTKSQTADRTKFRMVRRIHERYLLRRERMLRVLKNMGFLPDHLAEQIDQYGKFIDNKEPKLAWRVNQEGRAEFLFLNSFNEMLADFAQNQPQLVANGKKVPYDWTIYYLRKKALTQKLEKEELAWILLQFNQKRGYYQLRGEDEEEKVSPKTRQYFDRQIIADIIDTGQVYKELKVLTIVLQNGDVGKIFKKNVPNWIGQEKNIIATVDIDKDGNDKYDENGQLSRRFRIPTEAEWDSEWKLIKIKTEEDLNNSDKTIGCYIYDTLLQKPDQKIIGKLVRTVERKFYKEELKNILEKQKTFVPELQDAELYQSCIELLYPNNEAHRNNIAKPDFTKLFVEDILFYQRPLKSKKSLISDCPYETRYDKEGKPYPVKCVAKSNPLFQEFRLWQFVQYIRIYQREDDIDVTQEFLKSEDEYVKLFDWLNDRASIKQDTLLNSYFKIKKLKGQEHYPYRWNYVEDKEYPCNETRATILAGLTKCCVNADFLSPETEMHLWHILYSVEDKIEINKALAKFAEKYELSDSFVEVFSKVKPFKKDYGSYSEKAIKKLLPLMRMGKFWNESSINPETRDKIEKIISGEYDDYIKTRVREKAINLIDISHFRGLPVWLACYIVYGRHSEAKEIEKWGKPEDIDLYLKKFKQHSLRNPIVEQVITETLRTVRDIWRQEGQIDEIHVELGREMKNPADKRKKMTERILENESANLRIKAMLMEFTNPEYEIENVRPYSPSQQDILRIYEESALDNLTKDDKDFDFVNKISKTAQPSKLEISKYKLWLEQKYRSPYTGEVIPLAKLFTSAYEIEHVIPQSRYFDDSFSNKVICEAEVNKLKDKLLGYEFIKAHHGEKVQLSQGKVVEIFSVEAYQKFVKDHYSSNRPKMRKLLMEDIPDDFIERQLNDSRYISKLVKGLLSNIVREKDANGEWEQEAVSKNVISCNGSITDRLKKDWGMNDVWNSIVLPRFKRLNQLTGKDCFTKIINGHEVPDMPLELQKGFNKKRIDHRHHAMDAIVIACTTRNHVNLLNNEAAHSKHNANRYQLQRKLRRFEKMLIDGKEREIAKEFTTPWDSFTTDARQTLESIIVSFKQNLRVINKTTNLYQHFDNEGKKVMVIQAQGDSWAIRKSMHKDTGWGEVNLRFKKSVSLNEALKSPKRIVNKDFKQKVLELLAKGKTSKDIKKYVEDNKDVWSDVDIKKIEVYYFTQETKERYFATRFMSDLVDYMSGIKEYNKALDRIGGITDTGIQKILKAHLQTKDNNPELAFSADGIDEMNRNIVELNGGRPHKPIYKVRRYESGNKYSIGQTGCKAKKFVEADKGTNLFFAIFSSDKLNKESEEMVNVRSYLTIPLNEMVDCQKKFGAKWHDNIETCLKEKELVSADAHLLFILSPNDLVYLPTAEELRDGVKVIDKKRIYKMVSCTGNQCFFIDEKVAKTIVDKVEFTSTNKAERAITGEMIKETCIPLKVDRIGNIIEFNNQKL
ncbi:MAG: type II CRISPR RNA-guided endonuclease Cas9 [Bacteroidales bacterium]|nr:type II CRISPR RNA-guided endonuclease Cas9 [Bacteroidales bacterium]